MAAAIPWFLADPAPPLGLWMALTRESEAAKASQIAGLPSGLPSSISSSSKSRQVWRRMLSTQRVRVFSALYTGTMMEIEGT